MEYRGQEVSTVELSAHYGKSWDALASRGVQRTVPFDLSADFHEFAVLWSNASLEYYVDNSKYAEYSLEPKEWRKGYNNPCGDEIKPFTERNNFVLNLAVGGSFFSELGDLTVEWKRHGSGRKIRMKLTGCECIRHNKCRQYACELKTPWIYPQLPYNTAGFYETHYCRRYSIHSINLQLACCETWERICYIYFAIIITIVSPLLQPDPRASETHPVLASNSMPCKRGASACQSKWGDDRCWLKLLNLSLTTEKSFETQLFNPSVHRYEGASSG